MKRTNSLKLAFVTFFFKYGLGLLSYPIFLHYLNTRDAGIYFLMLNSGALFDLLDLNFKNSLVIRFSQSIGNNISVNDKSNLSYADILAFSKFFYAVICAVALLVIGLGFAIYLYFYVLQKGFVYDYYKYLSIWAIFCLSSLLQVYYTYLGPALSSKGHIDFINRLSIKTKIIGFIVQMLLLVVGFGLFALALATAIATVYERLSIYRYYKLVVSEVKNIVKISLPEFKRIFNELWETNYKLGLVSFALIINSRAPAYFIGMLHISQSQITAYLFTMQLVNLIFTFSHIPLANNFADLSYYFVKDTKKFVNVFNQVNRMSLIQYVILIFLFISIGPAFIKLLGIKHSLLSLDLVLIIGVIYFFEKLLLNYTTIICITNKIPMYRSFILSSLFIVLVQIILVSKFNTNLLSVILPQFIVQIVFNYWLWPLQGIKMVKLIADTAKG